MELKSLLSHKDISLSVASASLDSLVSSVKDLNSFARSEVDASKREIGLSRVSKLREEVSSLEAEINHRRSLELEVLERQRSLLLDSHSSTITTQDTILQLPDSLEKESQILDSASNRIEEFIHLGKSALQDLHEQRSILKVYILLLLLVYPSTITRCSAFSGALWICDSIYRTEN